MPQWWKSQTLQNLFKKSACTRNLVENLKWQQHSRNKHTSICMYLFCDMYTDIPWNLSFNKPQDTIFSGTCLSFCPYSPFLPSKWWWDPGTCSGLGSEFASYSRGYMSLPLSGKLRKGLLPQNCASLLCFLCLTLSVQWLTFYIAYVGQGKAFFLVTFSSILVKGNLIQTYIQPTGHLQRSLVLDYLLHFKEKLLPLAPLLKLHA